MDRAKQEKITRFLDDKLMQESVFAVLRDAFTKHTKNTDVQTLAAERLAINLLHDAWRELERCRNARERTSEESGNPAL